MTDHAKTPVRAEEWTYCEGTITKLIIQNDTDAIAEVLSLYRPDDPEGNEQKANADLIVRAVNHHDEMVKAIRELVAEHEFRADAIEAHTNSGMILPDTAGIEFARELLAKIDAVTHA